MVGVQASFGRVAKRVAEPLTSDLASKMESLDTPVEMEPPKHASQLSEEELRKQAAQARQFSAALGDIVGMFMRTKELRKLTLGALEKMVVPAIATGQYLIARAQSKDNGMKLPVAAVLWATVSETVDHRLSTELDRPIRLEPEEWKSGGIPWLICVTGDRRVVDDMLRKLQSDIFKNTPIKIRRPTEDGRTTIDTISAGQVLADELRA